MWFPRGSSQRRRGLKIDFCPCRRALSAIEFDWLPAAESLVIYN